MAHNITHALEIITNETFLWYAVTISLVMLFATPIGVALVLLRLPEDYLLNKPATVSSSLVRLLIQLGRNIIGIFLLIVGIALLILPGQGILLIATALIVIDSQHKRRLENKFLLHPTVFKKINHLRETVGKLPLIHPDSESNEENENVA